MKSLKEILRSLEGLSDIELFVIDLFCGAGGLSEGVEEARLDGNKCAKVVCCVNHDKNAILSHDANIPDALHFIEDIRTLELSPISTIVERIRQLYPDAMIMLHASLECTNFSKAKGGQPRDADSRTLAEHLFRYIDVIDPDYIQIENVEEFMSWGDMDEKGKPISMDKGRLYQKWVRNVKKYGYNFEHRILNAADFGAYTTRKRFFGIFAKKSLPIVFPEPTHCKGGRKDMFSKLEKELGNWDGQVWGFDFDPKEINRAVRFKQQYPDTKPLYPLIERQITKQDAMGMLWKAGIEIPAMYKMGYNNNNCIGCVKGGMGYWNKIRKDFPNVFDRMAKIEREVGATCLKDQSGKIFLDELSPNRGEMPEEMIPDCSLICQIEFQELLDRQVERVLKGEISINDVT